MRRDRRYVGIDRDRYGGMTPTGNIIRDAWVFGILPEAETCAGWDYARIEKLYDQVTDARERYGHRVSNLPPDLRSRHQRIYDDAVKRARDFGWEPDMEED